MIVYALHTINNSCLFFNVCQAVVCIVYVSVCVSVYVCVFACVCSFGLLIDLIMVLCPLCSLLLSLGSYFRQTRWPFQCPWVDCFLWCWSEEAALANNRLVPPGGTSISTVRRRDFSLSSALPFGTVLSFRMTLFPTPSDISQWFVVHYKWRIFNF